MTDKAEAVLIRQYKKLLSEMDHIEEELKQSDNQHVVGYMKDVWKLTGHLKSWLDKKRTRNGSINVVGIYLCVP